MQTTEEMSKEYYHTIEGKVLKNGRKYFHVVLAEGNEKYPDQLVIDDITKDLKVGDTFILKVDTEKEYNRYSGSTKVTHTATNEAIHREKEIARWYGYLKENWENDGSIYRRAIRELHDLGCHDYDNEVVEMENQNAIYWIRHNYKKEGYIYKNGLNTLIDNNCHAYDEEIAEMEKAIKEAKEKEREEKEEKRRKENEKYDFFIEEAFFGYKGRYQKGDIILRNGKVYSVVSCYFDSEENETGFPYDIYRIKAEDITETDEGQKRIAIQKISEEIKHTKDETEKTVDEIKEIVEKNDSLKRAKISMPGKAERKLVLYDTIKSLGIVGGGQILFTDHNNNIWFIINNGSDGGWWEINHIETGGAGAYGYKCSVSLVENEMKSFKRLQRKIKSLEKKRKVEEEAL